MANYIGIYKELEDNEKVLTATPDFVQVESNASELSNFDAKIYLTNKNLLFLIAKVFDWKKAGIRPEDVYKKTHDNTYSLLAGKDPGLIRKVWAAGTAHTMAGIHSSMIGRPLADSKSIVMEWMEVPLHTMKNVSVDTRVFGGRKNQLTIEFDAVNQSGFLGFFKHNPKIVVHTSNSEMWQGLITNAMKEHRVLRSKELGEPPVDENNRYICIRCGTHYEKDKVKMVKCRSCGEFVCRAQLSTGVFSKNWIETDCVDTNKGVCVACAKTLPEATKDDNLKILKERYAKGEITKKQYQEMKNELV